MIKELNDRRQVRPLSVIFSAGFPAGVRPFCVLPSQSAMTTASRRICSANIGSAAASDSGASHDTLTREVKEYSASRPHGKITPHRCGCRRDVSRPVGCELRVQIPDRVNHQSVTAMRVISVDAGLQPCSWRRDRFVRKCSKAVCNRSERGAKTPSYTARDAQGPSISTGTKCWY